MTNVERLKRMPLFGPITAAPAGPRGLMALTRFTAAEMRRNRRSVQDMLAAEPHPPSN